MDLSSCPSKAGASLARVCSQTSNAVDFYVQVPTSLSIVAGTASGTTEQQYTSTCCGTVVGFKYQVNDQASQPIRASMSM